MPQKNDLTLTTDEIEKYCEWVRADTINKGATIKEASLASQTKRTHTHSANAAAGYTPRAIPDLVNYYHAAAGFPIKATWLRAIKRGYYIEVTGYRPGRSVAMSSLSLSGEIVPSIVSVRMVWILWSCWASCFWGEPSCLFTPSWRFACVGFTPCRTLCM